MPLQSGVWSVSSAAIPETELSITGVDQFGNVSGNFGGKGIPLPIRGYWDEDGQRLQLLALAGPNASPVALVFSGYLFTDPLNTTGVTGSVIFTLAGEVEFYSAVAGATARRSTFGWYAQIGVD